MSNPDVDQSAPPPQSKLMLVTFSDQTNIDEAVDAIVTNLSSGNQSGVYRLAVLAKATDGQISVRDITEESHGTVGAGALIGALTGCGVPAGAASTNQPTNSSPGIVSARVGTCG